MIKTYIINLPRCRDRRESILRECARFALEPEIFPGIDGQTLTKSELGELLFEPERNTLTSPEIGCGLSHLAIYRDMIERNAPYALILEDDSIFKIDPRPLLSELECLTTDAPDVYLLTHRNNRYIASEQRQIGDTRFYRGWDGFGANGYVITRNAAANLLRFQTPLKCVCDWWKLFQRNDLIKFYIAENEIVGLHPEFGDVSVSLIKEARNARFASKSKYFWYIRKQTPLWLKIKYILYGMWKFWNIRTQRISANSHQLQNDGDVI